MEDKLKIGEEKEEWDKVIKTLKTCEIAIIELDSALIAFTEF